jgi:hypothetical protein
MKKAILSFALIGAFFSPFSAMAVGRGCIEAGWGTVQGTIESVSANWAGRNLVRVAFKTSGDTSNAEVYWYTLTSTPGANNDAPTSLEESGGKAFFEVAMMAYSTRSTASLYCNSTNTVDASIIIGPN